ncbi:hydroxyethylthiazole kinase [Histophilus somni]|uniref:Hydroxyethylthiazole kinase n=1 Tax=Histophilus somni TaxID=731 RepID=A0AAX2S594_HISSO|nr:hydroxyethylthiazole kinase [Histophilus somni]TDF40933.1 hydroxyethylthiazole kinase [Histophilus somni]TEW31497.1 hydroxyethylthiazole kinase [Histophilus somni]TFF02797.1 hydroxyethylthiazole kinase [Histophilus somni]THA97546.1 hydroxyethylthiazole kinase [Histophilus somni]TJY53443.1 hydroxyethylthiazole kinase [Histophilus somni]
MNSQFLTKLRQRNPLIHNITNIVAANFSANGLLAIGASPIMSACIEEMEEMAKLSQSLVINIGTLTGKDVEAMLLAGKTANQVGIPVVLDPVGVGATTFRQKTTALLLEQVQFSAIRGNAGELAYIAGVQWSAKGVDAGKGMADIAEIAHLVARKYQCIAVISGETDYISDGKRLAKLNNGTPLFPKITASGCLLSAVCSAFLAVAEQKDYFDALVEGCSAYAIAGEIAAQSLSSTQFGQFTLGLLDQLASLTPEQINQYARISYE